MPQPSAFCLHVSVCPHDQLDRKPQMLTYIYKSVVYWLACIAPILALSVFGGTLQELDNKLETGLAN